MKKKLSSVFGILVLVGLFMYFLISAIMALTNKKDLHTINLAGAFEILEVEHAINGLIPIGKDHYYIGIEEESYDAYIIKASKRWFKNNFGSDYLAKDAGGVQITALAGEVRDFDISRELQSRTAQMEELNYPLGTEYCLNMGYKVNAIMKLFIVAFVIVTIIAAIALRKPERKVNSVFSTCWIVGLIIAVIFFFICLR
ncbi:MAG: hypothetical protein K2K21_15610 [Lachnospiraceae bacterium]|nr:hypothetical protein [Lachnospiraceae bacterium]